MELDRPDDYGGSIDESKLIAAMQSIYKSQDVVQVNLPAESGDMGILANHVPSIEQLKPGLVEVIEESGGAKQFFRTSTEWKG
jgi:F-type H+-transporting ATPase subunit delta